MTLGQKQLAVIVPVYNDTGNLGYCLSALTRARGDFPVKIVVVDDGSSESVSEAVDGLDITYIRNEHNRGQSWARNKGAEMTESEYILFVDSDVVVDIDLFRQIAEFISAAKPDGLIGMRGIFSLEHPFQGWASLIYNTLQHLVSNTPLYSTNINSEHAPLSC